MDVNATRKDLDLIGQDRVNACRITSLVTLRVMLATMDI